MKKVTKKIKVEIDISDKNGSEVAVYYVSTCGRIRVKTYENIHMAGMLKKLNKNKFKVEIIKENKDEQ